MEIQLREKPRKKWSSLSLNLEKLKNVVIIAKMQLKGKNVTPHKPGLKFFFAEQESNTERTSGGRYKIGIILRVCVGVYLTDF